MYFDILNRMDMAHECDGQMDGQTIACSNSVRRTLMTEHAIGSFTLKLFGVT